MLNGLDLFSGIGGLSIALKDWVRPIAYCEIDAYCQGVLLNRMGSGDIHTSPIWDDIRKLSPSQFPKGTLDIIYGGFPCQDISVAGRGKGLEGERSGLFFEIVRLAKEIKPPFIFLENVPAITSRGGIEVVRQIAEMGYDCRWLIISAASIGALHRRERWFLLAYSKHTGSHGTQERGGVEASIHPCEKGKDEASELKGIHQPGVLASESISNSKSERSQCGRDEVGTQSHESKFTNDYKSDVPNPSSLRCDKGSSEGVHCEREAGEHEEPSNDSSQILNYWQNTEPPVCGMAHGIPNRLDRIRGLGNAVVLQQAKEAFEILMGLK